MVTGKTTLNNRSMVGILLLSVTLAALGQLLFKAALNQVGEFSLLPEMLLRLGLNVLFLLGLAFYGGGTLLWLLALSKAEISFAYPFLSVSYIIILGGGALLFNDPITIGRILGVVLIVAGLTVVARG
jgi:drug/metabolite transporter (DMT)-like permease